MKISTRLSSRRLTCAKRSTARFQLVSLLLGGATLLCFCFFIKFKVDDEHNEVRIVSPRSNLSSTTDINFSSYQTPMTSNNVFFHQARSDRSGAVIHDMLLAHAYAYQQNRTYGGACANTTLPHYKIHKIMIETLGLSHVLKFTCPPMESVSIGNTKLSNRHLYTRFGTSVWTPEWLDYIQSQQHQVQSTKSRQRKAVVAHIRRGDVSLCDLNTRDRYLPNQHYKALLEEFDSAGDVTIFSESKSSESWKDFQERQNYALQLDRSPVEAWKAMMDADVLIMSKSSFSLVPAVFNRHGLVVYTPFWVKPLKHWKVVDDDTFRAARRAELRLRSQYCSALEN